MSQRRAKAARRLERSPQGRAAARVTEHVRAIERRHPGVWHRIEALRAGERWWPEWCWLPLALAGAAIGRLGRDPADRRDIAMLAALAAWRQTRGIYLLDPDLAEALAASELEDRLPVDPLYRLPEWCVYLAAPGGLSPAMPDLVGAFAHLEHEATTGRPQLRLVLDDARIGPTPLPIALDAGGIGAALREVVLDAERRGAELPPGTYRTGAVRALGEPVRAVLAGVLYLCSAEPDLAGPLPPQRPGGGGAPAENPRGWQLGWRIGASLRRAREAEGDRGASGRRAARAHVRRGHFHRYWTGPRADPSRRELVLRWVAPTLVGAERSEDLVATVRRLGPPEQPEPTR